MSEPVIRAERLGKLYAIGEHARYKTMRESITGALAAPGRRRRRPPPETIWALRGVSFEVSQGDVVGIIGRNGAGKSTLLKILARITEPTEGRAFIRGRIGSLLEIGTGFHPELSGRENVYLAGAILGMRRIEIARKFDEIVSFAEVEKFIDTPLKHYSSGMYVRLAFAVAAHLEPEILLVDEVLAVGDAAFQRKCLGRMGTAAREGRTVLFVSHNMAAVQALCQSGIVLHDGAIEECGEIAACVASYLGSAAGAAAALLERAEDARLPVQILAVGVLDAAAAPLVKHPHDEPFWIELRVGVREALTRVFLAFQIHDGDLATLVSSRDVDRDMDLLEVPRTPGTYIYRIKIPAPLLVPGAYSISVQAVRTAPVHRLDGVDHVCPFQLVDRGSALARMGLPWRGKVHLPLEWERVEPVQPAR